VFSTFFFGVLLHRFTKFSGGDGPLFPSFGLCVCPPNPPHAATPFFPSVFSRTCFFSPTNWVLSYPLPSPPRVGSIQGPVLRNPLPFLLILSFFSTLKLVHSPPLAFCCRPNCATLLRPFHRFHRRFTSQVGYVFNHFYFFPRPPLLPPIFPAQVLFLGLPLFAVDFFRGPLLPPPILLPRSPPVSPPRPFIS